MRTYSEIVDTPALGGCDRLKVFLNDCTGEVLALLPDMKS